jgi:CHAT domain-containing protein/tetratricopeptide (TPR) repeat protein
MFKFGFWAVGLTTLLLSGCQSDGAISLNEAKKIAAGFQVQNFPKPERTISSVRKLLKNPRPIPANCDAQRAKLLANMDHTLGDLDNSRSNRARGESLMGYSAAIDAAIEIGRFDRSEVLIENGLNEANAIGVSDGVWRSTVSIYGQQARMRASMGDISGAESALSAMRGVTSRWSSLDQYTADYIAVRTNQTRAEIALADGDVRAAEIYFRRALNDNPGAFYQYGFAPNRGPIHAGLAKSLLLQKRPVEAEVETRSALDRAIKWATGAQRFSPRTAGIIGLLAEVLMEQGRLDDAEYAVKMAINMYEASCAAPQAGGLLRARKLLMAVYGSGEKWTGVKTQSEAVRSALAEHPALYERMFGNNLNVAEAEIYAGNRDAGFKSLNRALEQAQSEFGASSRVAANIKGLIALANSKTGQRELALQQFSEILDTLSSGGETDEKANDVDVSSRRNRLLTGYMKSLQTSLTDANSSNARAVQESLLRVASLSRLGRVQQAFTAVSARSSVSDPELAKLIRQEQDVSEELRVGEERLAYLVSLPDGAITDPAPEKALRKRLPILRQARKTLKTEIDSQFPDFAELTNPKPLDMADIRRALNPDQAMVVFHVLDDRTYVWALAKNQEFKFVNINIGRKQLSQQISALRTAVDPGPLSTLADIPDYDVTLAHTLYQSLLEPVKDGWQGARELIVVADGPLGSLPLSMLVSKPGSVGDDKSLLFDRYRNVAWLAEDVSVTQIPSINGLKTINATDVRQAKKQRPFIGFGDPYFSWQQARDAKKSKTTEVATTRGLPFRSVPQTRAVDSASLGLLPRLADTRTELQSIAIAMKADPTKDLFLGADANEAKVKSLDLTGYKVISFATHGLVPGDLDGLDQPALALTAPRVSKSGGDGLLTMNEILTLKLDADFTVLSACNTAAADGEGAEAVSGLGRAFLYAGSRALLVSNWPVHSGATTLLMTSLFGDIANNATLSRTEALRRTRIKLIEQETFNQNGKQLFSYAHPIFWAPFTIIGNGGRAK